MLVEVYVKFEDMEKFQVIKLLKTLIKRETMLKQNK